MLLRWLLVWEEPVARGALAVPCGAPGWFAAGRVVAAERVPSRWGTLAFRIESQLDQDQGGSPSTCRRPDRTGWSSGCGCPAVARSDPPRSAAKVE